MFKLTQKHPQLRFLCYGTIGGAVTLGCAFTLGRNLQGLPVPPTQLWMHLLFGGLIGALLGGAEMRTRSLGRQLRERENRLLNLFQKTPAMIYSMDAKGHLIYVSQAWLDTLGYNHKDIIGRNFFDFVVADDLKKTRTQHFRKLNEQGEVSGVNYRLRQANGSEIEVSVSEIAQKDTNGKLTESLAVMKDLTTHRAAEQHIERLAYFDTLTGLPNRALMNDRIVQSIAMARRDNRQVGVFFFDLDRFKRINDTQGHAVGDMVLRSVAQRLKKFIRGGDTFARLGGDEFVIVQADPNHDPNFSILGRRILETLGEPFQIDNREFFTTASIGVAIYPVDGDDPQTLLKSADTAMYVAKNRGRNNIQFFSGEMNAAAVAKSDLESRLREALKTGALQQHYQAQVNLNSGRITGVEALLRWHDDDGKIIPTTDIIDIAEESGLIFPLGEWVLKTACTQAKAWQDAGLPPVRMSVNLSAHHLRQSNFIDHIESVLSQTGLHASNLEIELSENSIMGHVNESIMTLTDLKVRGINLSIDDFGTGYSSLLYLKHLPIHRIKIAQEFIRDIIHNPDYAAITEAIIVMAHSLKLDVSAVGVEDPTQLKFLRDRRCTEAQGCLFGVPMNAGDMAECLKDAGDRLQNIVPQTDQILMNLEGSHKIH